MLLGLKTIGTLLTVASTASFGKDMYDKYKGKKKSRQLEEVHQFIGSLDLEALQDAMDSKNEEALIDAVNDIMIAAEAVRVKSDMEELADDAQLAASKIFGHVTTIASKVADKVGEKLEEVKSAVDEMEDDDLETESQPTYKEFKKQEGCMMLVRDSEGNPHSFHSNSANVFTSNKEKKVTFLTPNGEAIVTQLV